MAHGRVGHVLNSRAVLSLADLTLKVKGWTGISGCEHGPAGWGIFHRNSLFKYILVVQRMYYLYIQLDDESIDRTFCTCHCLIEEVSR